MRVVLTRLSALGDIVHTWPLVEALTAGGSVELAWVVEEPFLPLVAGHPGVSVAIPVATRRWRRRLLAPATRREVAEARRALRAFAPGVALDPQGLMKSAAWARLSGARERVGFARGYRREAMAGVAYTRTVVPPPQAMHVVDINLALAAALGREARPGAAPDGSFLLTGARGPSAVRPGTVALLPGTGGRGKAWPRERFSELAAKVLTLGAPVTVVWGPGERVLAESIAAAAPGAGVAPPTNLPELIGLLSRCSAVVGGDTGPVHLAASLGVPTVAVFVATDPDRNGPRGRRVAVVSAARSGARRGNARTGASGEVPAAAVLDALTGFLRAPERGA